MTAPDDLARTLARELHVNVCGPAAEVCSWTEDQLLPCSESDGPDMLAAHLASVVSRRDADLRTRIEALCDEAEGLRDEHAVGLGEPGWVPSNLLRAALDGDTRGAP